MHPDTLLDCKERVKTVTEFGSIAPAAAGADVLCGWLQPLAKIATISTSVLIFHIRFCLSSDRALPRPQASCIAAQSKLSGHVGDHLG